MRRGERRSVADGRLRLLPRMPVLPHDASSAGRPLLRVLLVRQRAVPTGAAFVTMLRPAGLADACSIGVVAAAGTAGLAPLRASRLQRRAPPTSGEAHAQ